MNFWKAFNRWWWGYLTEHAPWARYPVTWVFHGVVASICVAVGAVLGLASHGFAVGVGYYTLREIESLLSEGVGSHWWDRIGDVVGPVVFGLLTLWVL